MGGILGQISPEAFGNAVIFIITILAGMGSRFSSSSRHQRAELKRLREVVELQAAYRHKLVVQLQDNGITPRRMPERLALLTQEEDDE